MPDFNRRQNYMEKNIRSLNKLEEFNSLIQNEDAVLFYFSHEKCNVCKVLKPKIASLLDEKFSKIKMFYVDTVLNPEIAGQNSIFAVPTIIAFFGGREYLRKSRNIALQELEANIERPYKLIFDEN